MNEAANDSGRVSGQDRKIPSTLETNHIAGFGGLRPLASLGKIIYCIPPSMAFEKVTRLEIVNAIQTNI